MDAYQIIEYIRTSPKKTPVRVWLQTSQPVAFPAAQQFPAATAFQSFSETGRISGRCWKKTGKKFYPSR